MVIRVFIAYVLVTQIFMRLMRIVESLSDINNMECMNRLDILLNSQAVKIYSAGNADSDLF